MKQYFRPWGSYICIDQGVGYQVKRLIVNKADGKENER